MVCGGTPKFSGRPCVPGGAQRGPVPSKALPRLLSPATVSLGLPGPRNKTPPRAKKLGVTSGASAVRQNRDSRTLIPGDLGATRASGAFLRERKARMAWWSECIYPSRSRGTERRVCGWGGGIPQVALPDSLRALQTPLGLEHPKRRACPPPGSLTDSADTQATKPKVSRIQARCIFPGDRLLPADACNQDEAKPLAQRPAQPAQRNPKQSSRSDRGSGSGARAPGSGALACSHCPRLRPGTAAPSHLLVSALLTLSCRSREAALWSSSCSAVVLLLRGLLPRVAAQFLVLRNKLDGLECSCSWSLGAEQWGRAVRATGAPGVSGEKRVGARLVAQRLRPSSSRAAASLPGSSSLSSSSSSPFAPSHSPSRACFSGCRREEAAVWLPAKPGRNSYRITPRLAAPWTSGRRRLCAVPSLGLLVRNQCSGLRGSFILLLPFPLSPLLPFPLSSCVLFPSVLSFFSSVSLSGERSLRQWETLFSCILACEN